MIDLNGLIDFATKIVKGIGLDAFMGKCLQLEAPCERADEAHGIGKGRQEEVSLLPEVRILLAMILLRERGVADDA